MGVDTETEIDEDSPTLTAEVSPELSHMTMDLSAILGPMTGGGSRCGSGPSGSPSTPVTTPR